MKLRRRRKMFPFLRALRGLPNALIARATAHADDDAALFERHDVMVSHEHTGNGWPGPWG